MAATSPWAYSFSGLNIHRINLRKSCFSKFQKVQEIISFILDSYQSEDKRTDPSFEGWDSKDHKDFSLKISVYEKNRPTGVGAFLEGVGAGTKQDYIENTHYYVFFMYRSAKETKTKRKTQRCFDIYALTLGDGSLVVKRFADFRFPIKIALRVLDPNLRVIESKPLAGHKEASTETYRKAYCLESHELDTIWRIFKVFVTTLKKGSSMHALSAFDREKDCQVEVGYGKVRIFRQLPFDEFPNILDIFSIIHWGDLTKRNDGSNEIDDQSFNYLKNIRPVDEDTASSLTDALVKYLGEFFLGKIEDLDLQFTHRYYRDYYSSHTYVLIYGNWKTSWYYPPSTYEVATSIKGALEHNNITFDLDSREDLRKLKQLLEKSIRFRFSRKQNRSFPVLEFFGGEFPDKKTGGTHFFNDGIWLRVAASHLEVLQRNFFELVKKETGLLIPRKKEGEKPEPGWLSQPWIARDKWAAVTTEDALVQEVDLKALDMGLKALQKRQFSFIGHQGTVLVDHLSPCILGDVRDSKAVDKKWFELEEFLKKNKGKVVTLKDLREILPGSKDAEPDKGDDGKGNDLASQVYKSLQKPRPVCTSVKVGKSSATIKTTILNEDGAVLHWDLADVILNTAACNHFKKEIQKLLKKKFEASESLTEKDLENLLKGRRYQGTKKMVPTNITMVRAAYKELKNEVNLSYSFKGGLLVQGPIDTKILNVPDKVCEYLIKKHKEYCSVCKEEGYNRTYLGKSGFIVCDQVYATKKETVEFFDILQEDKSTEELFLYHVKETFGQPTREACAQIRVAAQKLRADMDGSYSSLERLHANCMKGPKTAFRNGVKKQFNALCPDNPGSSEGWLEMFKSRQKNRKKIVFVYAFIDHGSPERRIEEEQSPSYSFEKNFTPQIRAELKKKGYLSKAYQLTEKFLTETKSQFIATIEGGLGEEEKTQVHQVLKRHENQFNSMGAKVELMHVRDYVESQGFSFKICQINRAGRLDEVRSDPPTVSDPPSDYVGGIPLQAPPSFVYESQTWYLLPDAKTPMDVLREVLGLSQIDPEHIIRFFFQRAIDKVDKESYLPISNEVEGEGSYRNSLRTKRIAPIDWKIAAMAIDARVIIFKLNDLDEELAVNTDNIYTEFNTEGARTVCLVSTNDGMRICRIQGASPPENEITKEDIDVLLSKWPEPRGIQNSGTDCFINAALQLLAFSPLLPLVVDSGNLMLDDAQLDECEGDRRRAFQSKLCSFAIEYHLRSENCSSPTDSGLRDKLSELDAMHPEDLKKGHQDTSEFFTLLAKCYKLDGYISTFSVCRVPDPKQEKSLSIEGENLSEYTQIDSDSQSVPSQDDINFVIPLPIPKAIKGEEVTFQSCLKDFYNEPDSLSYKYLKGSGLYISPVSIRRENKSFGEEGVFFSYKRFTKDLSKRKEKITLSDLSINLGGQPYKLKGFICHNGDRLEGGHYIAYCLCGDEKWRLFNDSAEPKSIVEKDILEHVKDAYVLHFTKTLGE